MLGGDGWLRRTVAVAAPTATVAAVLAEPWLLADSLETVGISVVWSLPDGHRPEQLRPGVNARLGFRPGGLIPMWTRLCCAQADEHGVTLVAAVHDGLIEFRASVADGRPDAPANSVDTANSASEVNSVAGVNSVGERGSAGHGGSVDAGESAGDADADVESRSGTVLTCAVRRVPKGRALAQSDCGCVPAESSCAGTSAEVGRDSGLVEAGLATIGRSASVWLGLGRGFLGRRRGFAYRELWRALARLLGAIPGDSRTAPLLDVVSDRVRARAEQLVSAPLVVGTAIIADGSVLAAQRERPAALAGRWEFPGGRVEFGETEQEAVVRECREELDAAVRVVGRVGPDLILPSGWLLRIHAAELVDGQRPAALEHRSLRWITEAELESLNWIDADRAVLPALRALLLGRSEPGFGA